jgi:integrase
MPRFEGVFYRNLKSQFNGKPDRCFEYCYQHDNKKRWVNVGRESRGATPQEALRARLEKLASLREDRAAAPLLGDLFDRYYSVLRNPHQQRITESIIKCHLQPAFGPVRADRLARSDLERFKQDLQSRYAVSYVLKVFCILSRSVSLAIEDGLFTGPNPVTKACGFQVAGQVTKCERFLTQEEAELLLTALKKYPEVRDMAFLSLHTGIRLTELYSLTRFDLQPDGRTAIIKSKYGRKEALYLTPEAVQVIRSRSEGPGGLLFPKTKRHTDRFRQAVKACGFNDGITDKVHRVWFHTLRHTFASWLAQKGVDLYVIQKLMRHSDITMTQRYAHLLPNNLADGLNAIRDCLPLPESV